MTTKKNQICLLDNIINDVNNLNAIASPTDAEEKLIDFIVGRLQGVGISYHRISPRPYLRVPPLLIGNPDAKYVLVTHCDRVIKINDKVEPLHETSQPIIFNDFDSTLIGKLDNTVSLSICLKLMYETLPKNTSLLVTTAEECGLRNISEDEKLLLKNDKKHQKGGRGLISYLEDNVKDIEKKKFICVDVRPLDNGNVFINPGIPMQLGDGLVLRLEEHRKKNGKYDLILEADQELVGQIRTCAANINVSLIDFHGPKGTTELGRGWEKLLQPKNISSSDYQVAWIQPPIEHYHTTHEQMSSNDVINLCKMINCLINKFETA